jgi:two-component system response regulator PilR (NtrC family)
MAQRSASILLVEDDLSLRDSLVQFLNDHGHRTATAATAKEGWELLKSRKVLLVLLDLNLPDGSGLELLKRIVQAGMRTRVVVMTAFDLAHLRPAGAGEVLAGWMTKPVHPGELLKLVEKVLSEPAGAAATHQGRG